MSNDDKINMPQAIRADNPQALSVDELSDDQMQAIADAKHPAIEAVDCLDNFIRADLQNQIDDWQPIETAPKDGTNIFIPRAMNLVI